MAGSHLTAQPGKVSLPSSHDRWQFLSSLGREEEEGEGKRGRERESASKMEVTIFCNVVRKMTSHPLYHIVLFRSNAQVSPMLKGRRLSKV